MTRPPDAHRRFLDAERGAAAPLLGIVFLMLIGCIGLAVDTGRSMVVKARLTNALDAAGLAVGARVATTDFTADAKNYVAANFKANYAAATVTKVTATANSDKSVISLSATATMPTAFMKLFGINSVTVNAVSEVTRASTGLELAMVLDNTGSMDSSMTALKNAANSLVNILYGDDAAPQNLYVGLVPFSQAVNIGSSHQSWVTPSSLQSSTNYGYPSLWTGCVEERAAALDQSDDPPSSADAKSLFRAYYSPSSSTNSWLLIPGVPFYTINYNQSSPKGPGAYCPAVVTGMTNTKATVVTGIANMKAAGSTLINVGAVWGWRMLSPRWRGQWGGTMDFNSLPLDYNTKSMNKAVVLMTDGANSLSPSTNYTAYSFLSDGRLGSSDPTAAENEADKRLARICTSMKAKGIYVYTVAFNITDADTKKLMETCATSTSYYFDAANSAALNAAFQTIGSSLSKLRLSK